jgi:carbon monoxide dehydrogenase subunit G
MELNGSATIDAPADTVWRSLNDPEILRRCIPGCEVMEQVSETEWRATLVLKLGLFKPRFTGTVNLSNLAPPDSYTITAESTGGMFGSAKGAADVSLTPLPERKTRLDYALRADVGGRIAQLGARLVGSTANHLADLFFARFTEVIRNPATPSA